MSATKSVVEASDTRTLLDSGVGTTPATPPPSQPEARSIIQFGSSKPTDEQRAWGMENTAALDVRWVQDERKRSDWTDPDGVLFRQAGLLYIRRCMDGVTRFVAHMNSDAIAADFKYFERIIARARLGIMQGWDSHTYADGFEGWWFDFGLYGPSHTGEVDDAPAGVRDEDSWGYLCDEPLCKEKWHEELESHTHQLLENAVSPRCHWDIEICRDPRDPDSDWYVNFWVSSDMTELTPAEVSSFTNDLMWMAEDCKNLNLRRKGLL